MKLNELISDLKTVFVSGTTQTEVLGLCEDSRATGKDYIFFARHGSKVSGIRYVDEALQKGACAIVTEDEVGHLPVPLVRVPSVAEAESAIADKFYGYPSKKLTVIGVTGTNGKTTFTYLLESIAREIGLRVAVIGTINYRVPLKDSNELEILSAPNTTPNALELQKLFSIFVDRGVDLVIMEVSSHALALGRVDHIEFDGAVFTNLTQDHLDFHRDMEDYFNAKSKLFNTISTAKKIFENNFQKKVLCDKFCIINFDDSYGMRLTQISSVPVTGYGIKTDADYKAAKVILNDSSSQFQLLCAQGEFNVKISLIGIHNIYNSLASIATATHLNIPVPVAIRGLEKIQSVPGRLEPVHCDQNFTVLIDYAHTEDALRNVLQSLRPFAKRKVLTLFGCGGDRDRSKRPLMGATAVNLSDWVIVTSDNPRSEDPNAIALDIEVGIHRTGNKNYEVILDRGEAIKKILRLAQKDDLVLIAGKGHETYQIFADKTVHFDDREIVRKLLCYP